VFFGYPFGQKGYRLYDLDTQQIFSSRDVVFHEHLFLFSISPSDYSDDSPTLPNTPHDSILLPEPDSSSDTTSSPSTHHSPVPLDTDPSLSPATQSSSQTLTIPTPPLRRSTRPTKPPPHFQDYHAHHTALLAPSAPPPITPGTRYPIIRYVSYSYFSAPHTNFVNNISQFVDPSTYEEARHHPHWVAAMNSEIHALEENHTWSLVPLPTGHRPIGCKWVFKTKYRSDGSIERHKARLVAKGFNQ